MTGATPLYARPGAAVAPSGPRILVASVSAGTGHVRAAEAIVDAMRSTHPLARAVHVNVLEHTRPGFRRIYEEGYAFLVNRMPAAWGQMYRWTDHAGAATDPLLNRVQQRQASAFLDYVRRFRPDRIIATHFLLPQLLSALPGPRRPKIDVVVTDFDVHRIWIHPLVDRYFVASETARQRLMAAGVPPERAIATGIPIHPQFLRPTDAAATRASLSLVAGVPTALVLAGGQGFGALHRAVTSLFESPGRLQIVSVAGRNTLLKEAVDALACPEHITLRSLGFVNTIPDLLSIADVVVTKPGGLTVAEGLAKGVAMVLHSAIPGQEDRNADFAALHGAALKVTRPADLPDAVFDLLGDPARLAALREGAAACGRPRAAFAVAQAAVPASPAE